MLCASASSDNDIPSLQDERAALRHQLNSIALLNYITFFPPTIKCEVDAVCACSFAAGYDNCIIAALHYNKFSITAHYSDIMLNCETAFLFYKVVGMSLFFF